MECNDLIKKFEDNPTYTEDGRRFPGVDYCCYFEEDLDIGYRYYDRPSNQSKIMYPFGFGLSCLLYTSPSPRDS